MMGGASATSGLEFARRGSASHEASRAGMDYTPLERTGAFKAAGRHTARVRLLRRAFILGAIVCVSVIAIVALFDPFRHLPTGVSISGVGIKGSKITIDSPKLSGVQQGGGPYKIEAKTGLQDITTPGVMELLGVDAHIGMSDKTMTHVLSNHGLYDSKNDTFALQGNVKIDNSSGYRFGLKSALVDFKHGTLTSQQRMRVDIEGGDVIADGMTISNNGHQIAFRGHVHSTFASDESGAPQTTAQAGPTEATQATRTQLDSPRISPTDLDSTGAVAQEVSR